MRKMRKKKGKITPTPSTPTPLRTSQIRERKHISIKFNTFAGLSRDLVCAKMYVYVQARKRNPNLNFEPGYFPVG